MTPAVGADQYSEITYDQDPGAASWVGVTTRIQSAGNGSGYLAIVYAGEVRLYRADDSGGLELHAAGLGECQHRHRATATPAGIRGQHHRVYFNGTQVISHDASGRTPPVSPASPPPSSVARRSRSSRSRAETWQRRRLDASGPIQRATGGRPAWGTTQATMSLTTGENATCRFSTPPGVAYGVDAHTFTTTGSTAHATAVSGLTSGSSYVFYVRCVGRGRQCERGRLRHRVLRGRLDVRDDSNFAGVESPLVRERPLGFTGRLVDLHKNDGAYAVA